MNDICVKEKYEVVDYEKEQLELDIQQREIDKKRYSILEKRMTNYERQQKNMFDLIEKQDKKYEIVKEDIECIKIITEENKKDLGQLKNMTYVLKNDNDGKLTKFKARCHARVKLIVGKDKSGYKYILFYNCYISNIYSSITTSLYGERCNIGNISIYDYEMAIKLSERWQPSEFIITQQIKKYMALQEKNKLSVAQSKSLDEYLEEINGGNN